MKKIKLILLLLTGLVLKSFGQDCVLSLKDCVQTALKQNLEIQNDALKIEHAGALRKTSFDPDKTVISLDQDPTEGGNSDNALTITQNLSWPGVYVHQSRVNRRQQNVFEKAKTMTALEITRQVAVNFYDLAYISEKIKVYQSLDSIYRDFAQKATVRVNSGETNHLEALAAKNKFQEIQILLAQAEAEWQQGLRTLQFLLNLPEVPNLNLPRYDPIKETGVLDSFSWEQYPQLEVEAENIHLAEERVKLSRSAFWPDFVFGYSEQLVIKGFNPGHIQRDYFPGTRVGGFQIGLALPVFSGGAISARVRAGKIERAMAENRLEHTQKQLKTSWLTALQNYKTNKKGLNYYENSGLALAMEQLRVARISFDKGDIGYVEFIQNVSQAIATQLNYLDAVHRFNDSALQLQFLSGKFNFL